MSHQVIRRLSPLLAVLALACSYEGDGQMSVSQNFAIFNQGSSRVIDAVTDVLVAQGALAADLTDQLDPGLLDALSSSGAAHLNSESVSLGSEELAALVPEEVRRFIGEEGGRYVLELTVEPAPDGGLRVSVTPTIIATVRGGEGPLGGRPLPSNGSLERRILDALRSRLGG